MNVQDRISKIEKYFRGMKVDNIDGTNIIYVIIQFPKNWMILDNQEQQKYNVSVIKDESQNQFLFCTEMTNGFDCVFDAIDENIKKMLAIIERTTLLKQKISELQELFGNEDIPIESLRTLEFKYKQPKQKKKTILVDDIDIPEENNDIEKQETNE